jgi:hypothetical protein
VSLSHFLNERLQNVTSYPASAKLGLSRALTLRFTLVKWAYGKGHYLRYLFHLSGSHSMACPTIELANATVSVKAKQPAVKLCC